MPEANVNVTHMSYRYALEVAQGKSIPRVAQEHHMSMTGVRAHIKTLRLKYGARNTANLIHRLHMLKLLPRIPHFTLPHFTLDKPLTVRELTVVAILAEGFEQLQTANNMNVNIEIFKQVRKQVLKKLNAVNTPNIVHMAHLLGVLPVPDHVLQPIVAAQVTSDVPANPPG